MFSIAHVSDLHFSHISKNPFQIFNKRWLGTANLLFFRKKLFSERPLHSLFTLWRKMDIRYLLITGDLSCTSHKKEFIKARGFLDQCEKEGISVFALPGNHDNYTKKSHKEQLFYQYFPSREGSVEGFSLENDQVAAYRLEENWYLLLLDNSLSTNLLSSQGFFSHHIEKNLIDLLQHIPQNAHIILANHFPFTPHISIRNRLARGEKLENLLKQDPRIVLYLHGHTHNHCIADLRPNQLPIIMESGSSTFTPRASWNYLTLEEKAIHVTAFTWKDHHWEMEKKEDFIL